MSTTKYEVFVTSAAERDLRDIYEYIAIRLESPRAARGQVERIRTAVIGLSQMPNRFRAYDREPWSSRGIRIRAVDNYLVFYIVGEEEKRVTVVRVIYGDMDVEDALVRTVM